MQALEDGSLELNTGFHARKIAEVTGIVNSHMTTEQNNRAMYNFGLRFSPISILEPDHFKRLQELTAGLPAEERSISLEESEFAIGSLMTWEQIEQHHKKVTNRTVDLPTLGMLPTFANYFDKNNNIWQPTTGSGERRRLPKLRVEAGHLAVSKSLANDARAKLEKIAAEEDTPSDGPLIATPALAKNLLKLMSIVAIPHEITADHITIQDNRNRIAA